MAPRSSYPREESQTSRVIDLSEFAYDGEEEELESFTGKPKSSYDMGKTSSDPIFFGSGDVASVSRGLVNSDVASPVVVTKR
jgi:hypothetical protein